MKTFKILLDIDGVMIPARPWQNHQIDSDGFGIFNRLSVIYLNDIISNVEKPEIILTTSHKNKFTINQWCDIFLNRGVTKIKISKLETDSMEIPRIEEIRSWYLKNENENFIIIDDDKGLNDFDNKFKDKYLVLTNSTIGLNNFSTYEAINKIKKI